MRFKRPKSIAELGHLPKYDDRSSRAWLYGKLFMALLEEKKMMRAASAISSWGYWTKTTQNTQRVACIPVCITSADRRHHPSTALARAIEQGNRIATSLSAPNRKRSSQIDFLS
jgi:hypothetical protein